LLRLAVAQLRFRPGRSVVLLVVLMATVACFGADGTPNRHTAVKRVAATAGDPLPHFLSPQTTTSGELLPVGHLAVLGDNMTASADSRQWGLVPVANVLATVVRTLY
jgi:hypothetical protein